MREEITPTSLEDLAQQLFELRNQFLQHNHSFIGSGVQQGEVISGFLRSSDYVAGSSGWMIGANNNCEFNTGTFRSSVTGATITGGIFRTAVSGNRIEITEVDKMIKYYDTTGNVRGEIGGEGGVSIGIYNEVPALELRIGAVGDEVYFNATEHLKLSSGVSGSAKRMIWDFDNIQTETDTHPDMGTSTYRLGGLCNVGISCWGNILPNTDPSYSSLGEQTRYWQYLWAYYVRYKDLASFQNQDDISLIKNIKEKKITRYQVKGYDKTKRPPAPIKKYETIKVWDPKTMPKETRVGEFCDAGAINGFLIGIIKQLIEKVEQLEKKMI